MYTDTFDQLNVYLLNKMNKSNNNNNKKSKKMQWSQTFD